jgi:protein involved in polysaccharide export with SLBB domain
MKSCSLMSRFILAFGSLVLGLQLGCATPGGATPMAEDPATAPVEPGLTSTEYRPGDRINIDFIDTAGLPSNWQQTVREDGTITLPLGQIVRAAGLRKGELESAIHDLYVPRILRRLTVNVRSEQRSYFVSGEVKNPGQKEHTGLITAMKAVAAAGDFTDFANKSKIEIIRANGQKIKVNGKKALDDPSRDEPVYPGDRVHVHRRFF